ncbi:MAG TPA: hypothetical protein VMV79_06390 [Alphaproteobacteria bacterium]|nr:hypothetical protein [Alphaproteobacteria bacterium]
MTVEIEERNAAVGTTGRGGPSKHTYVTDFEDKLRAAGFELSTRTMEQYLFEKGERLALSKKASHYGKGTFYVRIGGKKVEVVAVIRRHQSGSAQAGVVVYEGPKTKKPFKGEYPIRGCMMGEAEFPIDLTPPAKALRPALEEMQPAQIAAPAGTA